MPQSRDEIAAVRNPLWIISIFLGFAEATAGIAATTSEGWISGMFAIFAVAMPTLVVGLFFRILMTRPHILYAPGDFSATTPVHDYVVAMSTLQDQKVAYQTLVAASAREAIQNSGAVDAAGDDDARAEDALVVLKDNIRNGVVTIDLSAYQEATIEFVVGERSTVSDLLNYVYFGLAYYVDAFAYGEQWVLKDARSGRLLAKHSTKGLAKADALRERDPRPLADVGVTAGSLLEVIALP